MKRRRNGEGTYTRNKKGIYIYSCRYEDPVTGKAMRKYIRAKTQVELDIKVVKWKAIRNAGMVAGGTMTVGEWCEQFLLYVKPTVKIKTYKNYAGNLRLHVIPALGKIKLNKLTTAQIQMLLTRLGVEGLSPVSVATVRRILIIALNRALDYGLLPRNPAVKSKAPRIEPKLPVTLSYEEVNRLLANAEAGDFLPATNDESSLYLRRCYYMAMRISLESGVRLGEMLALRWCDLHDGKLYITRAMEGNRVGTPKTKSSYRAITLSKKTLVDLANWQEYQKTYSEKWGLWDVCPSSLIFTSGWGTMIYPQNMAKRWWRPLLEASRMPKGIHWHSLRATMATLLLQAGVPVKVVSERLGHSSVSVTLMRYAGIVRGIEESTAVIMDNILSGRIESPTVNTKAVAVEEKE